MKSTSDPMGSCIVARSTTIIGSAITMDDPRKFSYQGSVGFSSAVTQLQLALETESAAKAKASPKQKLDIDTDDQGQRTKEGATLLSMWGMKSKTDKRSKDSGLSQVEDIAASSTTDIRPESKGLSTRSPLATIPQDLAARRLNPVMKKPSPSGYVFLSSSPPEAASTAEEADRSVKLSLSESASLVKPARTYHETTVSQVQQSSNLA